jgi:hypothetical protein
VNETSHYLKKTMVIFLITTLSLTLLIGIFSSWQVGLVFGALFGLFTSVHVARNLQAESFEITTLNKDKLKGFSFYEKEVISIMHSLSYELITDEHNLKVWSPSPRARIMGGEFKMETSPYSITLTGSRGTVRIVISMLDIEKIFI